MSATLKRLAFTLSRLKTHKKAIVVSAFLLLALPISIYTMQQRTETRQRASGTGGESRFTLSDLNGKILSGSELAAALKVEKEDISKQILAASGDLSAQSGDSSTGTLAEAPKRILPTTSGFNVEQFTGQSTVSYPFQTPPVRGNLGLGFGLSYSSGAIDELRVNRETKPTLAECQTEANKYECWDTNVKIPGGILGIGWNLSGLSSKVMKYDDRITLVLPSGSIEIIQKDDGTYTTIPDQKVSISRLKDSAGKARGWVIVDGSGTTYVFGSTDEYHVSHETTGRYHVGSEGSPYCISSTMAWHLTAMSDIHGNTAEMSYEQDRDTDCSVTKQIRPTEVKYNWDDVTQKYVNAITFTYALANGQDATDADKSKYLTQVSIKSNSALITRYDFGYTLSFKNKWWSGFDNGKTARRLLTTISKKGYEGAGSERPHTFCYKSLKSSSNPEVCNGTNTNTENLTYTPNDIYLTKADNGYGGVVTYSYAFKDKIDRICSNRKDDDSDNYQRICTGTNDYMPTDYGKTFSSSYYVVTKTTATNGNGQSKATEYTYEGTSLGYAEDFPTVRYKPRILKNLQFFGYPTVRIKVYDGASTSLILSNTKDTTLLSYESGTTPVNDGAMGSCFMPHPQKGQVHEHLILNASGAELGRTTATFITNPANATCQPKMSNWGKYEALPRSTTSQLDGKKSKSETFYDFDVYGVDTNRNWGNVVKTIDYGNPDLTGDETYSYTRYLQDDGADAVKPYYAKNIRALAVESFISTTNASRPQDVPNTARLQWKKMKYDERVSNWGYQSGVSGVKALPSSAETLIIGKSHTDQSGQYSLMQKLDYDKYGNAVKTTSHTNVPSVVYYDPLYHMLPVCTIQWKVTADNALVNQAQSDACSWDKDMDKKFMSKTIYDENVNKSLTRMLPNQTIAGMKAQSRYEYDEYGRQTKVYQPDKDTGAPEAEPVMRAYYYDSQTPMRTRQEGRLTTDTGSKYLTTDTFYDGFGNTTQTVMYGQSDATGGYALASASFFNGIGQVTKSYAGIPLRNLALPSSPTPVVKSTLDANAKYGVYSTSVYDFFSRPTTSTVVTGSPAGTQLSQTTKSAYSGYTTTVTAPSGNTSMVKQNGRTTEATSYLCASPTGCTASTSGKRVLTTKQTVNALGKVVSVVDEKGVTVQTGTYNSVGAPLQTWDADIGSSGFAYDANGRVWFTVNDRNMYTMVEAFDILDRPTTQRFQPKGMIKSENDYIIKTTYDTAYPGKVTQQELYTGANGATLLQKDTASYTKRGEPKESVNFYGFASLGIGAADETLKTTQTITSTGVLTQNTMARNNGSEVLDNSSFMYQQDGKLKNVKDNMASQNLFASDLAFNYRNQLAAVKYQNSIQTNLTYDALGRVLTATTGKPSPAVPLYKETFGYNGTSQLLTSRGVTHPGALSTANFTNSYFYDSFSRLTSVGGVPLGEYTGTYTYDDLGNILTKSEKNGTANVAVSTNVYMNKTDSSPCRTDTAYVSATGYNVSFHGCPYHGLKSTTIPTSSGISEVRYYLYDKKGNRIGEYVSTGTKKVREYKYESPIDKPTLIITYNPVNGTIVSQEKYVYGLNDARIAKINPVSKDYTFYMGAYEKTKKGSEIKETVLPATPVGSVIKTRTNNGAWVKQYPTTNYQGSTVFLTDQSGNLLSDFVGGNYFKYTAYGTEITPKDVTRLARENTYTGQKKDQTTSLMYYNARYYDPKTSTFMQADTVADGLNRYAYVKGNPVMGIDPTGMRRVDDDPFSKWFKKATEYAIKAFPNQEIHIQQGLGYLYGGIMGDNYGNGKPSFENVRNMSSEVDSSLVMKAVGSSVTDLWNDIGVADKTCNSNKSCYKDILSQSAEYHALAIGGAVAGRPLSSKIMNIFLDQNNPGYYELSNQESNYIFENKPEAASYMSPLSDLTSLTRPYDIQVDNMKVVYGSFSDDIYTSLHYFTADFSGSISMKQLDVDEFEFSMVGSVSNIYDVYDWDATQYSSDLAGISQQSNGTAKPFTIISSPAFNQSVSYKKMMESNWGIRGK